MVIPAFLFSCTNDDDKVLVDNLPVEIQTTYEGVDGDSYISFTYFEKLITGIKNTNADGVYGPTTVKIDYEKQKPVKVTVDFSQNSDFESHTIDFTYDGDNIIATYSTGYAYDIIVDAHGNILKITTPSSTTSFEYDNKGNIIKMNNDRPHSYDNNPGIFSQIETPQWLLVACLGNYIISYCTGNNYIESYYNEDSLLSRFKYEYNELGYPISAVSSKGPGVYGYPVHIKSIKYK